MARCPFAIFRGPIANMKPGGMVHPVRGLVLHVEEGTETGTDGWFHNPAAQASAHFGVARDGTLHQWVDTDDRAWAQSAGNAYWWSVETEGTHTEPLTDSQIATLAHLYGWLASLPDRIPTVLAESVEDRGFGWHGMGGAAWGGHYSCPGDLRRNQRADVLARIIRPAPPTPPAPPAPAVPITRGTLGGKPVARVPVTIDIDGAGDGSHPAPAGYLCVSNIGAHDKYAPGTTDKDTIVIPVGDRMGGPTGYLLVIDGKLHPVRPPAGQATTQVVALALVSD